MGLAEQRKVKNAQDNVIPKVQQQIAEAAGVTMPFDIDWDSFTSDPASLDWLGTTSGLYVIADGLAAVCSDDLGKEALAKGVKKVVVKNVADKASEKVAFEGGTLTVHWAWGKGDDAFNFGSSRIRETVEAGL
jgi:hypothetical protein